MQASPGISIIWLVAGGVAAFAVIAVVVIAVLSSHKEE